MEMSVSHNTRNKPKTKSTFNPATTTDQILSPSVQNNGPPPPPANTIMRTNTPAQTTQNSPGPGLVQDSAKQQDFTTIDPVLRDSIQTNLPAPSVAVPIPKPDTTLQVKKGKGIKGLNDSDYRIVPKKN